VLASLVPDHVVTAESRPGGRHPALLPEERPLVANAVERRRREFEEGRDCAHRVLSRLGWAGFPVLSGKNREPLWPPGVIGSITHCDGYVAAAAGRVADLRGIRGLGIDAEVRSPLAPEVGRLVLTEREQVLMSTPEGATHATSIFSAKEAIYKCWFPLTGRWLDYQDAEIDLDVGTGRFEVRLLPSAAGPPGEQQLSFAGTLGQSATHIFTVVTARVLDDSGPEPRRWRER
jgi:4'-phosphopantetheinyl transferase EntD